MTVSSKDTKIDVSADWNRAIFDRGRPFHIDGTELTFHIPFTGERDLLQVLAIDLHLISAVAPSGALTALDEAFSVQPRTGAWDGFGR